GGKPTVAAIEPASGVAEGELLRLAGSVEQASEHPLAAAIVSSARERGLSLSEPREFRAEPGSGVTAIVDGRTVMLGTAEFLRRRGADVPSVESVERQRRF